MWERVDEMNTMVSSSGTLSVACKVGHNKKKKEMNHYMDEFPNKLQQYILNIVDVTPNGNCGYKEITSLLGQG